MATEGGDSPPTGATPPRRVDVVPHTHWDREWYRTFPDLRLALVEVVDALLDELGADGGLPYFLLDGQLAAVDDYLEVRPERAAEVQALIAAGRLQVGPWYTLPDELLVSGETLVRNLELGMDRAEELTGRAGAAMAVGYLPDSFGHVAQMPQLLVAAGFGHAVVWRGVPAVVDRTGFWWEAPDGTRVRATYLPTGYGNGARMPDDPSESLARLAAWIETVGDLLRADDAVLWMNGGDHLPHQRDLPALLAQVQQASAGALDLHLARLADHLSRATTEGLPTWRGELRSSARANLLFGVTSNRVDVRVAAARAERALEQRAEPMWAAFAPAALWPARALELAWREVIRNAAHDSVCACSADEVVSAVLERYAGARQTADALFDQGLRLIGAALAGDGPVVVNTVARDRGGVVRLILPGDRPEPHEQVVEVRPARVLLHRLPAAAAAIVLEAELDVRPPVHGVAFEEAGDGTLDVLLMIDLGRRGRFPARPSVERMRVLAEQDPERVVRLLLADRPQREVLVHVAAVPGFGWRPPDVSGAPPVHVDGVVLGNGLLEVEVDPADGTFAIDGHAGLGRLVEDGDAGDTYSYCPPDHDTVVSGPERVRLTTVAHGPVVGAIRVDAVHRWPARLDHGSSARVGAVEIEVETVVELRAGERFVRVTTTIDNRAEDHRVRARFPLPQPAQRSLAECSFATVARGLQVDDGETETGLPHHPARRFVRAGGLTIAHEGVHEHELVDRGADDRAQALALTLLRATGALSRGPMRTRRLPAGPQLALRGSQVLGRQEARYAVAIGGIDPFAMADDAFVDLAVAHGAGLGATADHHQALQVDGAEVSSLRRRRGRLELRAFNPWPTPTVLTVPGRRGQIVDLRGRVLGSFTGRLPLGPFAIVTVQLDEA